MQALKAAALRQTRKRGRDGDTVPSMEPSASAPDDSQRVASILEELRNGTTAGLDELAAEVGEAGQLVSLVIRLSARAEALAKTLPPDAASVLLERVNGLMTMADNLFPIDDE